MGSLPERDAPFGMRGICKDRKLTSEVEVFRRRFWVQGSGWGKLSLGHLTGSFKIHQTDAPNIYWYGFKVPCKCKMGYRWKVS